MTAPQEPYQPSIVGGQRIHLLGKLERNCAGKPDLSPAQQQIRTVQQVNILDIRAQHYRGRVDKTANGTIKGRIENVRTTYSHHCIWTRPSDIQSIGRVGCDRVSSFGVNPWTSRTGPYWMVSRPTFVGDVVGRRIDIHVPDISQTIGGN